MGVLKSHEMGDGIQQRFKAMVCSIVNELFIGDASRTRCVLRFKQAALLCKGCVIWSMKGLCDRIKRDEHSWVYQGNVKGMPKISCTIDWGEASKG